MFKRFLRLSGLALFVGTAFIGSGTPAQAVWPADQAAAVATVNSFNDALLDVMKEADKLGYKGRSEKLGPVIDKTFNLPLMIRLLTGPSWNSAPPETQAALLDQFRRYTIGIYASRFDGYDGEKFETDPNPTEQRSDLLVQSAIVPRKDAPTKLNYIVHKGDHGWQVIDIYLQGRISQLATQRSEFQAVLAEKGPTGLSNLLNKKVAELSPGDQ